MKIYMATLYVRMIIIAFVVWPVALHAIETPDAEFEAMYEDVAAYVQNEALHPELLRGVVHPEYGDAKAYYPAWIYLMDDMEGFSVNETELEIAEEMIARYQEIFDKFMAHPFLSLYSDSDMLMHVAIGIEGVMKAYAHNPKDEYRQLARRYLDSITPIVSHPELVWNIHVQPYGAVTGLAGAVWFYLSYSLTFGRDDEKSQEYTETGLRILKTLDDWLYSEKGEKYLYSRVRGFDFTYAYTNTVIVQALVRAYALTGEQRYYDRALTIMNTLTKDLYLSKYEGFLSAEDSEAYVAQYEKVGPHYNDRYMCLSTHNYMIYAYLALYEASDFKEPGMIENSLTCFRFIKRYLWNGKGRIEHHIENGELAPPEDYCIGCSYQTLYNFLLLKAALGKVFVQGLCQENE